MDGDVELFSSIQKCVPYIMALTHVGTEKYHKVSEAYDKFNETKQVKSIDG